MTFKGHLKNQNMTIKRGADKHHRQEYSIHIDTHQKSKTDTDINIFTEKEKICPFMYNRRIKSMQSFYSFQMNASENELISVTSKTGADKNIACDASLL